MPYIVPGFFEEFWNVLFGSHRHHYRAPPRRVRNLTGVIIPMSTVTLSWTLPSTRTDGSALALTDIALVDIFDTSDADPSNPKIGTVNGPFTSSAATFTTGVLTVGNHAFTVVVQDSVGHRSAASNAFTAGIAAVLANPSAVSNLTGVVNP